MIVDESLLDLGHKDLYRLAEWHEKQAMVLRSRAHRLEERAEDNIRIDRRLRFFQQLPRAVQTYLRHGHALHDALGLVARDNGVPVATVDNYWRKFISGKSKRDMGERNTLMLDLAALGLTNPQIGERVGLHEKSVSRILSRIRRERLWTPPPGSRRGAMKNASTGKKTGKASNFPGLSVVPSS